MRTLRLLLEIAKAGGHMAPVKFTAQQLARLTGSPQSTVARWLAVLEREGLVKRKPGQRGQQLRLTSKGLAALRSIHTELEAVFNKRPRTIEFVGEVVSGLGEGGYYLRQPMYLDQFKRQLGFTPYPGTLNVRLNGSSLEVREFLEQLPGKVIKGFTTPERTFGDVRCFPARIGKIEAALVLPARSSHKEVVELIAREKLRDVLHLKDGDRVKLEVMV